MKKTKIKEKYLKNIVACVSKRSKANIFLKKEKESVNFDFKGVQKFFEAANGLKTWSIVKLVCQLSESFYRIKF